MRIFLLIPLIILSGCSNYDKETKHTLKEIEVGINKQNRLVEEQNKKIDVLAVRIKKLEERIPKVPKWKL